MSSVFGLRSSLSAAWRRRVCGQCCRGFADTPAAASGHNRWSKIRHEKGAADAKKTALRSSFTKTITLYSQMYGADIGMNPQLAAVVQTAKKNGVPKATIEAAIARGQGRSSDGARLETATFEVLMPPSVALIVDLETDSKARALQDLNALVRRKGGTTTPTKFFFARRGRVVFGPAAAAEDGGPEDKEDGDAQHAARAADADADADTPTADDILEDAIEAGAEDVETDPDTGHVVVWTPANQTAAVVTAVAASRFGPRLAVLSAETVWSPNPDTRAPVGGGDDLRKLAELLAALRAYPDVRAVYANAVQGSAPDDVWQPLAQDLDW